MIKPRARDLGLDFNGTTGPANSQVDILGVLVGTKTRIEGDGSPGGIKSGDIFLAFSTANERPIMQLSEARFTNQCLNA